MNVWVFGTDRHRRSGPVAVPRPEPALRPPRQMAWPGGLIPPVRGGQHAVVRIVRRPR